MTGTDANYEVVTTKGVAVASIAADKGVEVAGGVGLTGRVAHEYVV